VALRPRGTDPSRPPFARRIANLGAVTNLPRTLERIHRSPAAAARLDVAGHPVAYVRDLDTVRSVLDSRAPGIAERGRFFEDISRVIGTTSLVTCVGAEHRRLRRAVAPAFRPEQVAHYASTMIAATDAQSGEWRDGERIVLGDAIGRLTLDIAARALLGLDGADQAEDFMTVLETGSRMFYRLALPRKIADPLWRSSLSPANRRLRAAQGRIDALVGRVLDERRGAGGPAVACPVSVPGGAARPQSLLDVLLEIRDADGAPLSPQELRDQVVTFLFAGHETTAQVLTWLFVELSLHPDVEDRLERELDSVVGARLPEPSDLERLAYARAVVRETLRLHPPAWFSSRETTADTEIAGCPVPSGALIVVSPLALQRDPAWWPDPLRFDPERWTGGRAVPPAYLPFGYGRRTCIGASFALAEAVAVVATVLSTWHLRVDDPERVRARASVTLRTRRPVVARLERRRPRATE